MDKKEYEKVSKFLEYTKALRLLVEWAIQSGFGFDNIDDSNEIMVNKEELEKRSEGLNYTEYLILYAHMYMQASDEPYVQQIAATDVEDLLNHYNIDYRYSEEWE